MMCSQNGCLLLRGVCLHLHLLGMRTHLPNAVRFLIDNVAIITCKTILSYWVILLEDSKHGSMLHAHSIVCLCVYTQTIQPLVIMVKYSPSYYNHALKLSINFILKYSQFRITFFYFQCRDADDHDATVFLWAMFLVPNGIVILLYYFVVQQQNTKKYQQTILYKNLTITCNKCHLQTLILVP